jgi:GTP cyclohydrolase IA
VKTQQAARPDLPETPHLKSCGTPRTTTTSGRAVASHCAAGAGERDLAAAEAAAGAFLAALGVHLDSEHTQSTPQRMARAYAELLTSRPFNLATFDAEGYAGLVLVRGVQFASLCEHHALPFSGTADVAYLPGDRIAGVSKLARLVEVTACRPQVQERMTTQIADRLEGELRPRGVAVRVCAEHLCMTLRGAQARGAVMVTCTLRGQLADDEQLRHEWTRRTSREPV